MILAAANAVTTTVTTTMRVIDSVHDDTADTRTLTLVTVAAGLANLDVLVLFVADNTQAGGTIFIDEADFAARQTYLGVTVVTAHELRTIAGAAHHLRSPADLHLDSVNSTTDRHVLKWQAVTDIVADLLAAANFLSDFHTLSCQDVVVSTIIFFDPGNPRAAVGVVFDVLDSCS